MFLDVVQQFRLKNLTSVDISRCEELFSRNCNENYAMTFVDVASMAQGTYICHTCNVLTVSFLTRQVAIHIADAIGGPVARRDLLERLVEEWSDGSGIMDVNAFTSML